MHIVVGVDENLLLDYASRGASLFFGIHWEHDDSCFPMKGWSDFGVVVLGWWLVAATRLWQGADRDEFVFMDGPYSLAAKYDRSTGVVALTSHNPEVAWEVPITELTQEIVRSSDSVCRELMRVSVGERDREMLEEGIRTLRQARSRVTH